MIIFYVKKKKNNNQYKYLHMHALVRKTNKDKWEIMDRVYLGGDGEKWADQ